MARVLLLPSLALAATEYDVVWSARFEDTDGGCGIAGNYQHIAKGACVPQGGKFFMLESCTADKNIVKVFIDASCTQPDTPADVDFPITSNCALNCMPSSDNKVYQTECVTIGADVVLSECMKMSCDDDFTDGVATNCLEITTTTTTVAVECAFMPEGVKNSQGDVIDDMRKCMPERDLQCWLMDNTMIGEEADCKAPCVWYNGPSMCVSKETMDDMEANGGNYPGYWTGCQAKEEGDDCSVYSGDGDGASSGAVTLDVAGALAVTAAAAVYC